MSDGSVTVGEELIQIKCLQGWKGQLTLPKNGSLAALLSELCKAAGNALGQGDVLSIIVRGKRIDPSVEANRSTALAALAPKSTAS